MSEIRATTISDAAGTGPIALTKQSAAKAWVNFNGTGTVAIRDSQNVSGLVDNSTANYDVNFSNNLNNANYGSTSASRNRATGSSQSGNAVSSKRIEMYETVTGAASDVDNVNLAIHGDLA